MSNILNVFNNLIKAVGWPVAIAYLLIAILFIIMYRMPRVTLFRIQFLSTVDNICDRHFSRFIAEKVEHFYSYIKEMPIDKRTRILIKYRYKYILEEAFTQVKKDIKDRVNSNGWLNKKGLDYDNYVVRQTELDFAQVINVERELWDTDIMAIDLDDFITEQKKNMREVHSLGFYVYKDIQDKYRETEKQIFFKL